MQSFSQTTKLLMLLGVLLVLGGIYLAYQSQGATTYNLTLSGGYAGDSIDLERGLVGHWTFDGPDIAWGDSGGASINNRIEQGYTGYATSSMTEANSPVAGVLGQALRFNGVDDLVSLGNISALFVNATGADSSGSASSIAAAAFSVTTGNTIIVTTTNYTTPKRTVTGVTDTAGNTYTQVGSAYGGDGAHNMDMWVATDITGHANNVVTATFSGSAQFRVITALQYAGLASSNVYDVGSAGKLDSSTTVTHTTNTNSPDTTQANELLIGWYITWDRASAYSASFPNVIRRAQGQLGASVERLVRNTGAYSTTLSTASANRQASIMRTFKTTYDIGLDTQTVSFWVDPDTTTESIADLNGYTNIDISSGTVQANNWAGATIYVDGVQTTVFPDTGWHHVVVTNTTATSTEGFTLGAIASSYFSGSIDDVRIYDRALSAEEIQRLYKLGATTKINTTIDQPDTGPVALNRGLIGHWTFDGPTMDFSSSTAVVVRDVSGNGIDATSTIVTQPDRGVLGQALRFNYINPSDNTRRTCVRTGTDPALTNPSAITATAWVKPDRDNLLAWHNIVTSGVSGGSGIINGWKFTIDGSGFGRLLFTAAFDGTILDLETEHTVGAHLENSKDRWRHVAVTWSGDTATTSVVFYIDGVEAPWSTADDQAGAGTYVTETAGVNIGAHQIHCNGINATETAFPGSIDDVRIYDRVLSADEIQRLYNLGATTKINTTIDQPDTGPVALNRGLIGHWTFDGPDVDWGSTTAEVRDRSANAYHGNATTTMSSRRSSVAGVLGQGIGYGNSGDDEKIQVDLGGSVIDGGGADEVTMTFWYRADTPESGVNEDEIGFFEPSYTIGYGLIAFGVTAGLCLDGYTLAHFRGGGPYSGWFWCYEPSTAVPSTNEWHHYAVVFDLAQTTHADKQRLYVNGVLVSPSYTAGNDPGSSFASDLFEITLNDGAFDDVRIYDRILSEKELQRLYELGR